MGERFPEQGVVMTRLLAIAVLVVMAFLLIRYRTNEKLRKGVVITLIAGFLVYTASIIVAELTR